MIWFCLIVLALVMGSLTREQQWAIAACALSMVLLVALHLWANGAIP